MLLEQPDSLLINVFRIVILQLLQRLYYTGNISKLVNQYIRLTLRLLHLIPNIKQNSQCLKNYLKGFHVNII